MSMKWRKKQIQKIPVIQVSPIAMKMKILINKSKGYQQLQSLISTNPDTEGNNKCHGRDTQFRPEELPGPLEETK
jgi:hypothetical protein